MRFPRFARVLKILAPALGHSVLSFSSTKNMPALAGEEDDRMKPFSKFSSMYCCNVSNSISGMLRTRKQLNCIVIWLVRRKDIGLSLVKDFQKHLVSWWYILVGAGYWLDSQATSRVSGYGNNAMLLAVRILKKDFFSNTS